MTDLEQRFRHYLSEHVPELAAVGDFEVIAAGWESDTYAFTAVPVGRLVLRLYTGTEASRKARREPIIMDVLTAVEVWPKTFAYMVFAEAAGMLGLDHPLGHRYAREAYDVYAAGGATTYLDVLANCLLPPEQQEQASTA